MWSLSKVSNHALIPFPFPHPENIVDKARDLSKYVEQTMDTIWIRL